MKILNSILALVFLVFAASHLNDPAPVRWSLIYIAVAICCGLTVQGKAPIRVLWALTLILGLWVMAASPAFFHWAVEGFPNIAGLPEDQLPLIQETREFLGLLIAFLVMLHLLFQARREGHQSPRPKA